MDSKVYPSGLEEVDVMGPWAGPSSSRLMLLCLCAPVWVSTKKASLLSTFPTKMPLNHRGANLD
eukprot:4440912-Amphidinium_carterae.1